MWERLLISANFERFELSLFLDRDITRIEALQGVHLDALWPHDGTKIS